VGLAAVASGVLVLYGGVLLVAGALVLTGVIDPAGPVDRAALRWHVLVWDCWFLLWGCCPASPCSPTAGTPPHGQRLTV
jgi:hypothetical protein